MQVACFDKEKAAFVARVTASRAKLAHVEQLLYLCQSSVAVDLRMREAEKRHQTILTEVGKECDELLDRIGATCDGLKSTNSKFALDLPPRKALLHLHRMHRQNVSASSSMRLPCLLVQ